METRNSSGARAGGGGCSCVVIHMDKSSGHTAIYTAGVWHIDVIGGDSRSVLLKYYDYTLLKK